MADTTALAVRSDAEAYEPRDVAQALTIANTLVASRLLPRSITTPEQAFVVMATGKELGLTAMQSLRSIHVIEGKPSCSADLILALCKREPRVCRYFRLVTSSDKVATYETLRDGEPQPTKMSFTWDEALRAKLTDKDNWKKYPAAMLRARCIAALARAVYPDLVLGVYETDEIAPAAITVEAREIRNGSVGPSGGTEDNSASETHDATANGTSDPSVTEQSGEPRAATGQPSPEDEFRTAIAAATTVEVLTAIGAGVRNKFPSRDDPHRRALIAVYTARLAVLQPPPASATSANGAPEAAA